MSNPFDPHTPGADSGDEQWTAYEPTQFAQRPDLRKHDDVPPPVPGPPTAQPEFGMPLPQAAPPMYGSPYPYTGQPFAPGAAGPAPQTGQVSSIVALCLGGLLTVSCYGTLIGIAPLVLGIVGLTKSNSVSRLWFAGQYDAATAAAASSKRLAMWAWISLGIGVALAIIAVIVFVVWAVNVDPSPPTYTPYRPYDT
ncbi:hypothetical protein [Gordonia humi]|uniref:Interferon-induced transmembrane protein n=1 Tax=Gordonia humi TaxID=686429 RepID=A0A840EXB9_9ACTN|nr:hypothetical protein [Gordonia humi]MBB4134964.1 hypothetical protein [Gordonia humi]